MGRFNSPDPYAASGGPSSPASWNRYSYTRGDPINRLDPRGLQDCGADFCATGTGYADPSDPSGGGGYAAPLKNQSNDPTDPIQRFGELSTDCQKGLKTALPVGSNANAKAADQAWLNALDRAQADEQMLRSSAAAYGIDWALLAAVGIRETGFRNISQSNGLGQGIFQIDIGQNPAVSASQAADPAWAANWAAKLLAGNMTALAGAHPNLSADQLLQATAASYNLGRGGISGNPDTIDVGSPGNNYGSNVVNLINCFH
jgi:hypothetical protein